MVSKVIGVKKPISRPKTEIDVSDLLVQHKLTNEGSLIEEVELKPSEQARVFLGVFESNDNPGKFSVALSPETVEDEEVIRQVAKLELENGQYELILHIANYSSKVISAEIWRSV